jgi:two-component system NtrC family sensor kinase
MGAPIRALIVGGTPETDKAVTFQLQAVGLDSVLFHASTESDYVRLLKVGADVVVADQNHDLQQDSLRTSTALALLNQQNIDVSFIVVTESIGEEAVVDYMRQGATDVIFKDRLSRLGPAIARALADREARFARRRAEAARRYSETRFRTISGLISDFAYSLRVVEGGILVWEWMTEMTDRIGGLRLDELPDQGGWSSLAHPDDRPIVERHYARLRAGGASEAEFRIVTSTGDVQFLRDHCQAVPDEWGLLIFGAVKDITEFRQASLALRASEERFRQLFEHAADAVFLSDCSGRFLDTNQAAVDTLGYAREELCQLTTRAINPVLTPERIEILRQRIVARDVSERKRSERELQETRDFLRAVIDTVGDPIFVKDERHRWVLGNRAFWQLVGYPSSELLGKSDYDVFPKEQADVFWAQDAHALEVDFPCENEELITGADGQIRTILTKKASFRRADGSKLLAAVIRDVSERKAAEEALRASEERHRRIVETSSEGILVSDAEGRITFGNEKLLQMFGYALDELIGRPVLDFIVPQARAVVASKMEAGRHQHQQEYDVKLQRRDGSDIWIVVSASALLGPDGEFQGRLAMITDVTARRRAEEELYQAQKLESVGRLAAGIAHEINTPIQFVGDNVHFLRDCFTGLQNVVVAARALREAVAAGDPIADGEHEPFAERADDTLGTLADALRAAEDDADLDFLTKEVPRAIEQTLDGVERVASIVQAMKEFAHPDGTDIVSTDINQALKSTLTVARNELKYIADVETDFAELPLVPCQPSAVNQVFLNLLVNAAHAIEDRQRSEPGQGTIRVQTSLDGETVLVAVSDTGCGIPDDVKSKIFDQFFTTKEVGRGTGQGLALAHRVVVDQHGGTLTFESEDGRGTTFFLRLPLASTPREAVPGMLRETA